MPHPFLHAAHSDSLLVPGKIWVSAPRLPCCGPVHLWYSSCCDENGRPIAFVLRDPCHTVSLSTYGAVAEEERERRPEKRGKGKVRMFFKK